MWESAEKDADRMDNPNHYIDVIRSAFEIEEVKKQCSVVISKYEARGFKIERCAPTTTATRRNGP